MSDGGWTDLAAAGAVAPGEHACFEADGWYVVVYNVQGTLYALEDRCTHDDNPIGDGVVEGLEVICPRHGARFCLRTGAALTPPAYEPARTFAVKESAGRLRINTERPASP